MSNTPWLGDERAPWLVEVAAWIDVATGTAEVLGIESVRGRPWGAVLRVRTTGGTRYFKTPGHVGRHELAIIATLAPRWPVLAPEVLAVDESRSWLLLADHGTPMRDVLDAGGQLAVIERLLPVIADMQASTVDDVPAWLRAGVPDRRLDRLPDLLDLVLRGNTPVGPLPIGDDERAAYLADLPLLARVCDDLASTPVPDALDHADLHGTNVLVDGDHSRVIDWGDACITHPFSTVFVPFMFVVSMFPEDERPRAAARLRDAYLEPWGSTADQREQFALATWLGPVNRIVNTAHETLGEPDDHDEITSLLRHWHETRPAP